MLFLGVTLAPAALRARLEEVLLLRFWLAATEAKIMSSKRAIAIERFGLFMLIQVLLKSASC
jgi:hypothetical protein